MSGYIGTQPVPQATQTRDAFTATSGQTSFATSGYTPNFLDVFLNGVKMAAADYTASNGSDVVLATGAATGDILEVVAYTNFDTANVTGAANFTVTGSFTSQGIDDNANATAITIDSSENVLVGKTSTSIGTVGARIDNAGGGYFTTDGGISMQLNRLTSDGEIVRFLKDGTTVGSIASRAGTSINVNSQSGDLYLQRGGTTGLIVNPTYLTPGADATATLGGSWARFTDLYLSGGVFLGGTGAANKLDDYEEGTWTPGITTGSITGSYGSYTKIGRFIKVIGRVTGFSDTSSSARVAVTGLPYAAVGGNGYESTGSAFSRYVTKSAQAVYIPASSSTLYFYAMSSGDWGNQELDHSNLESSSADIYFSASYMTT